MLKHLVAELQAYLELLGQVSRGLATRPFYLRDTIEQMNAVGVASVTVVLLTGAFTGMVLVLQTGTTLDQFGARPAVGRIVGASMVRELGPVLTALMLTGRAGSGIAAELGSMTVTYQIAAMRVLGSDPVRKLVVPRVIAGTVMLPALTVLADAVGIAGGALMAVTQLRVARGVYWNNVTFGLQLEDIWMGSIKSVVLGFVIASLACHIGLRTEGGTRGVGQSTNRAVVACSVAVLVLNFMLTKVLIALMY
jgi:phospholipid/cholesterol/gamma-HCH transport system permease protein